MKRVDLSGILALGLLVLSAAGCGVGEWSWDEVARTRSPDGAKDAVVVERNGGATTSFGYEIFVVPHDQKVRAGAGGSVVSLYAAMRNDQAYGVNARWLANDSLAAEYLSAREAVVHEPAITRRRDHVGVVLRPGVRDAAAPGGGMLYNLERARHR